MLLAAMLLGTGSTASALDGDRFRLDAGSSLTYDDNLVRSSLLVPAQSDEILTASVGAQAHLLYSRQNYDATISLLRGYYRHFSQQNYSATNFNLAAGTGIWNAGHISAELQQSQSLTPLSTLQTLVRDVVTTRTLRLNGTYALDARFELDGRVSRSTSRNDFAPLAYNDVDLTTPSLGVSYSLADGSRVGLHETFSRASYPHPAQQLFFGFFPKTYDASYLERRTELSGSLPITPITSITGAVAYTERTYGHLAGQDTHGVYGNLGVDRNDGGPLNYGVAIRRELGGQLVLASQVVETDGLNLHAGWTYSALLSATARVDLARRRYSVDQPGFPAHREYETLIGLGVAYAPLRVLNFALDVSLDRRRATPEVFSYSDRRYTLSANLSF
jgi:hypothetical protein